MSNLSKLKDINFQFNKQFGQNFIFDTNLLKAIVSDAQITKDTNVLEIGAGAGTLTQILCQSAKQVVAFEIDNNLKPILSEIDNKNSNLTIIFKDILKQNTQELEKMFNNESYVIVANLPYYITTPIIFKFLEEANHLTKLIIMVQKEVAERIVANHSTKDYGVLTVSVNSIADTHITRIVKKENFHPQPNIDSAILCINFNKTKFNIKNHNLFKRLIKTAFAMRRKTLANNLKSGFNLSSIEIEKLLNSLQLNLNIRGENLSIEQFVELSNNLNQLLN